MEKLGFIGMGNMAQALAQGFINSNKLLKQNIFAFAPNQEKLKANATRIGFTPVSNIIDLTEAVDTICIACKPYQINDVLSQIKDKLSGKTIVSVAAGWPFEKFEKTLKELGIDTSKVHIQFVMPNTPAMVFEGVFLFEQTNSLDNKELEQIKQLFQAMGLVHILPSQLMGIGGAVTGCGPAFVDLMIEAYADAAVKYGVPRKDAYKLISQMILGSAKLCLETGEHPGVLKDNVCSPAGTTICGVAKLEEKGFRDACISSIDAIMNK